MLRVAAAAADAAEFEENIRRALLVEKLRAVAHRLARRCPIRTSSRNTAPQRKGEARVVELHGRQLPRPGHRHRRGRRRALRRAQGDFKIGEKRKIRSCSIDVDALRAKIDRARGRRRAGLQRTTSQQYTTPEQVRASHILLKTEGKDDAAVKAKAEDVLKQAQGGADFAALAKKYSEDEASAKNGGDLDYFGRGRMVPEFDEAAFAMQPGQISDLVKTPVRLPHHQAGRQEARHHASARRGAAADHRSARVRARAGRRRADSPIPCQRTQDDRRPRQGREGAGPQGAGIGILRARRADRRPRPVAGGQRAGLQRKAGHRRAARPEPRAAWCSSRRPPPSPHACPRWPR